MPERHVADFAVKARWILPVEPSGGVLEGHAALVRGGRILDVIPASQVTAAAAAEIIERPDHVYQDAPARRTVASQGTAGAGGHPGDRRTMKA